MLNVYGHIVTRHDFVANFNRGSMDKMSAAILMTDNWQPTVLQLMPFSSNNASQTPTLHADNARGYGQARGFPTLAVTRPQGRRDGAKPRRVSSERRPREYSSTGITFPPQRARSEYNSRVTNSLETTESDHTVTTVNNQIVIRTPDLSESLGSCESLSTIDVPKNVKVLPKPSPCKALDGRYFMPQNGFWRSVTLTPGEMEIQKHRDGFMKDNKKNKKYKLNVNQLPRSTTPINDNDPDKLNMKQVIRFLQTKEAESSPVQSPKKLERRVQSGYPSTSPSKIALRDSGDAMKDVNFPPMLPFRREVTSISFTTINPTTPVIKKRSQRPKRDADDVTRSSESANRSSFKTTREFRLHRFLTMAPNADEFTHVTRNKQSHPISSAHKRLLITGCSRDDDETDSMRNCCSPVPAYSHSRRGERFAKFQYRLPNKRLGSSQPQVKTTHSSKAESKDVDSEGVIRLPSMTDFNNDSENDESKDDDPWRKNVRNFRTASLCVEDSSADLNERESDSQSSARDISWDSDTSSKPNSRKVTISLPRESPSDRPDIVLPTRRTHDPVRLSLRQEQTLTREKTYMSDMARKGELGGRGMMEPKLPFVAVNAKAEDGLSSRNS
ncbi:uncharacterized protein LOC124292484 [Haliotis rubra]|uniref:uncharacterized protein LOC124292484 n=1 Tax=Haliotis rubra TaxID=36100 RepID=UPI001EE62906|nr:uncharacterized protein LOC124292484 [Haliotis rubra]